MISTENDLLTMQEGTQTYTQYGLLLPNGKTYWANLDGRVYIPAGTIGYGQQINWQIATIDKYHPDELDRMQKMYSEHVFKMGLLPSKADVPRLRRVKRTVLLVTTIAVPADE